MTGNREDAEEIVQDAFVRAYRALAQNVGRTARRAAAPAVALYDHAQRHAEPAASKRPTNVALDALADPDAILRESHEGPPQPEAIVEQNTDDRAGRASAAAVPMHLRAAATLRFIEGRSHPEIAEILNQPIGTVKSHVHRAVRILRRILGPQIGRFAPEGAPEHALS